MKQNPLATEIRKICDSLDPLLQKKEDYIKFVKEKTNLELIEANFQEILDRLLVITQEYQKK